MRITENTSGMSNADLLRMHDTAVTVKALNQLRRLPWHGIEAEIQELRAEILRRMSQSNVSGK